MIAGSQIRTARILLGWEPTALSRKPKVPLSVVLRAESSIGEPVVMIGHLNALLKALHAAGAEIPLAAE